MGAKHFLKNGARGVVRSVDFYDGAVRVGVEFHNQTFIYDGVERPVSSPHVFTFSEDSLLVINDIQHELREIHRQRYNIF